DTTLSKGMYHYPSSRGIFKSFSCPRILTERYNRNIAKLIKSDECYNAIQIQKCLISNENINISSNTIQRSLKRE
ncbi:7262_t:CDS:2, partial [Funneliformis geosporum]